MHPPEHNSGNLPATPARIRRGDQSTVADGRWTTAGVRRATAGDGEKKKTRAEEREEDKTLNGSDLKIDPLRLYNPYSGFNLIKTSWRLDYQSRVDSSRGRTFERLASVSEKPTDRLYPFNEGNPMILNTYRYMYRLNKINMINVVSCRWLM